MEYGVMAFVGCSIGMGKSGVSSTLWSTAAILSVVLWLLLDSSHRYCICGPTRCFTATKEGFSFRLRPCQVFTTILSELSAIFGSMQIQSSSKLSSIMIITQSFCQRNLILFCYHFAGVKAIIMSQRKHLRKLS